MLIISGDEYAGEIFEMVGGFPLALCLVGGYIFRKKYSYKKYTRKLKADPQHIFGDLNRHTNDHIPSMGSIWNLSFSNLQKNAKKMLFLFSFIGNDIPREMLERGEGKSMINWLTGILIPMLVDCHCVLKSLIYDIKTTVRLLTTTRLSKTH